MSRPEQAPFVINCINVMLVVICQNPVVLAAVRRNGSCFTLKFIIHLGKDLNVLILYLKIKQNRMYSSPVTVPTTKRRNKEKFNHF